MHATQTHTPHKAKHTACQTQQQTTAIVALLLDQFFDYIKCRTAIDQLYIYIKPHSVSVSA